MMTRFNPSLAYLVSGLALALALLIRFSLDPWLADSSPLLTLFAAVGVAAWLGGIRPAVIVVVAGYLACAWLFIEPRGEVLTSITGNPGRLAACVITSSVIIAMAEGMRSANRRAKEAMNLLHDATTAIPVPVMRCSRDFRYVWVSRGYADWMDRPVEDIIGRPIVDVVGPGGFRELLPYFERVLRGETVTHREQVHFHKIGPRWIDATYTPTWDEHGECDGWVASITELNQR